MTWSKRFFSLLFAVFALSGCFRYSFTGVAIPSDVQTIYIPFFDDRSSSGIGDLTEQLNDALIERFVNQSRLRITGNSNDADAILEGTILNYQNRPFSVGGQQTAELNRITITVQASFKYARETNPEWNKNFTGTFEFDPSEDPVSGEENAAFEALLQIANNMFNDALGSW